MLDKHLESAISKALEHPSGARVGIGELFLRYELEFASLETLEALGILAIRSGMTSEFVRLCLAKLDENAEIPWAHFVEGLSRSLGTLPIPVSKAVYAGAQALKQLEQLSRNHLMDVGHSDLATLRKERRTQWAERHHFAKRDLLSQVEMMRSQGLEIEEEAALLKLHRMFPKDLAIQKLLDEHRERKALVLLDNKATAPTGRGAERTRPLLSPEEEKIVRGIEQSCLLELRQSPELSSDFAILFLNLEAPESALRMLGPTESPLQTLSELWLRLELMVMSRRFVELMDLLRQLEPRFGSSPEDLFALAYIKARALWGLGLRFEAIEVLEGIVNHRPHYRSALTLLNLWKDAGNP